MNEVFILPLIVLGIYILQYLFKGPEDNKQQPGQRRGQAAPQRPNPGRPRRQSSDLDRFLEETRKRKQQEESKPVVLAEPANEPSLSDTAERERKAAQARPRPPQPQPQRPAPRPERRPRPTLREPAAPVLLELASPPASSLSARMAPPPPPQAAPATPQLPVAPAIDRLGRPASIAALAPSQRNTTTPLMGELIRLLTRPQGLAVAVILSELLETPVSRRRR